MKTITSLAFSHFLKIVLIFNAKWTTLKLEQWILNNHRFGETRPSSFLTRCRHLRWLEIVFEILFTRKQFTFIYIIITFMVAT